MLLDNRSRFASTQAPVPIHTIDDPDNDSLVTNSNDIFDDIFSSSPPHSSHLPQTSDPDTTPLTDALARSHLQERSDIPRLQSQHSTAGYREGIASSKALYVQEGFDEGYMLGAELGMRGGWIIGVLEGIVRAANGSSRATDGEVEKVEIELERAKDLLREAKNELSVKGLYAPTYFGQDGIWKYDVGVELKEPSEPSEGREEKLEEEELDFRKVANAHPVIKKWTDTVEKMANDLGLDLGRLKDREVEAGD
jgi:hypothetical protein